MKKILIAIDDGPAAGKIASTGFQLGKQLNAEIALLSVVDDRAIMTDSGIVPGELAALIKKDFIKSQQMIIDTVFKDYKVWTFVEEGKPGETIIRVAKEWEADLVVLGTHGRTGLLHVLMGSIAENVIRHSSIPVLIIPTKP
ncbi:MAG: universal stress protein [Bacteroidota bacterium]|nr:universal stress protein [Bacteroidota bacterium]